MRDRTLVRAWTPALPFVALALLVTTVPAGGQPAIGKIVDRLEFRGAPPPAQDRS